MTNPLFKHNYTDRDYENIRRRIVESLPDLSDGRWTDFNESDPGMPFVEVSAGISDMLLFWLDKKALENYLPTVEQRKNLKGILSIIGYKPDYYRSSVCNLKIMLDAPHDEKIVVPRYSKFIANKGTDDQKIFCNIEEIIIFPGDTEVNFNVKEGTPVKYSIDVDSIENYRFKLRDIKIAMDSVKLIVDEETELTEIRNIFLHDGGGLFFETVEDKEEITWVRLMPDWKDYVPLTDESVISVNYLISSGREGVAGVGTITDVVENIVDIEGNAVDVTIINTEAASGGANPETVATAAVQGPREALTMWTAVTKPDFKTLCEGHAGVRLVNVIDWSDHQADFLHANTLEICIVPIIGKIASSYVKESLLEKVLERRLITLEINIVDPTYIEFDIEAVVKVKDRTQHLNQIKLLVERSLRESYNAEYTLFNNHIRTSKIISLIHAAHPSISRVEIINPTENQNITSYELPDLKNVTLDISYDETF